MSRASSVVVRVAMRVGSEESPTSDIGASPRTVVAAAISPP